MEKKKFWTLKKIVAYVIILFVVIIGAFRGAGSNVFLLIVAFGATFSLWPGILVPLYYALKD